MWSTPLDYISLGVGDVRQWMEPSLARGYVEVTLVGDLTEAAVVSAVTRTLGSLAPRAATKVAAPAPVKVVAPAGFKRIEFLGEHNVAMVVANWPVDGVARLRDQVALELLTKILEIRLRGQVRDNLGFSYSPSASFRPYDGFGGFGLLEADLDCAPPDAGRVAQIATEVAARVAADGVTAGEFAGSRGILKSQYRRAFLDNGFLVSLLSRAQERPDAIDEAVALHDGLIDGLTLDEINAWAKKVLPADNSRTASLEPKGFVGIFDSAKP
jgi:zinc protease